MEVAGQNVYDIDKYLLCLTVTEIRISLCDLN